MPNDAPSQSFVADTPPHDGRENDRPFVSTTLSQHSSVPSGLHAAGAAAGRRAKRRKQPCLYRLLMDELH